MTLSCTAPHHHHHHHYHYHHHRPLASIDSLAATAATAATSRWAAACESLLKAADWSEALLGHELCEEVAGPMLLDSNLEGE